MDSFMDICIQDGGLTVAGERACVMVFEHTTGQCWHDAGRIPYTQFASWECVKCKRHQDDSGGLSNPPLTTSLDAWMPLWEAMGNELMAELFGMRVTNRHLLDPMWWLEASLRACGLYEKWQKEAE